MLFQHSTIRVLADCAQFSAGDCGRGESVRPIIAQAAASYGCSSTPAGGRPPIANGEDGAAPDLVSRQNISADLAANG